MLRLFECICFVIPADPVIPADWGTKLLKVAAAHASGYNNNALESQHLFMACEKHDCLVQVQS